MKEVWKKLQNNNNDQKLSKLFKIEFKSVKLGLFAIFFAQK